MVHILPTPLIIYHIDPLRDAVEMRWPMRYVNRANRGQVAPNHIDSMRDTVARRIGRQGWPSWSSHRMTISNAKPDQAWGNSRVYKTKH